MEDIDSKMERLDRDCQYFQLLLEKALPQEKLEIHRQILAILIEKKALTLRQIEQKRLENERMAKALEVLDKQRNTKNWRKNIFFQTFVVKFST